MRPLRHVALLGIALVALAGGCSSNGNSERALYDGCPFWSPDGQKIAFTRDVPIGHDGVQAEVFVVGHDGLRPRRLTRTSATEAVLGWRSRDEIVLRRGTEIYSLSAIGAKQRSEIAHLPAQADVNLAPTADRIAVRLPTPDARWFRVSVLDLKTGRRSPLPRAYNSALTWSANGARLTYGRRDLVMQLVTLEGKVLGTIEDTQTALPSPDGSQVAYDSLDKLHVWSAVARTARTIVVGNPAAPRPEPLAWSPDGRTIFYEYGHIRAIDSRTRRARLVSRLGPDHSADCLAVAPDHRRIAFLRVDWTGVPGGIGNHPRDVSLVVMNADGRGRHLVPKA